MFVFIFQGITFGFFEDLPADDKNYLEDILYGSKAYCVKIEVSVQTWACMNVNQSLQIT